MKPIRVFSGAPWEKLVSYCRAIKSGPFVAVSGTTSIKNGEVFAAGDPYLQAMRCFDIIEEALKQFDLDRSHVLRTRMFVTDISKWESFGKAHGEFFKNHPPAASMIEIKGLISPDLLIEVEVDAIAP
jgi:enamine deaminase RidA (YjgF/YER057c/UK114 family)